MRGWKGGRRRLELASVVELRDRLAGVEFWRLWEGKKGRVSAN